MHADSGCVPLGQDNPTTFHHVHISAVFSSFRKAKRTIVFLHPPIRKSHFLQSWSPPRHNQDHEGVWLLCCRSLPCRRCARCAYLVPPSTPWLCLSSACSCRWLHAPKHGFCHGPMHVLPRAWSYEDGLHYRMPSLTCCCGLLLCRRCLPLQLLQCGPVSRPDCQADPPAGLFFSTGRVSFGRRLASVLKKWMPVIPIVAQ